MPGRVKHAHVVIRLKNSVITIVGVSGTVCSETNSSRIALDHACPWSSRRFAAASPQFSVCSGDRGFVVAAVAWFVICMRTLPQADPVIACTFGAVIDGNLQRKSTRDGNNLRFVQVVVIIACPGAIGGTLGRFIADIGAVDNHPTVNFRRAHRGAHRPLHQLGVLGQHAIAQQLFIIQRQGQFGHGILPVSQKDGNRVFFFIQGGYNAHIRGPGLFLLFCLLSRFFLAGCPGRLLQGLLRFGHGSAGLLLGGLLFLHGHGFLLRGLAQKRQIPRYRGILARTAVQIKFLCLQRLGPGGRVLPGGHSVLADPGIA